MISRRIFLIRPGFGLRGRRALIRRGSRGGGGLPSPPADPGRGLRDAGRNALAKRLHATAALGDSFAPNTAQALDPAGKGVPDGRPSTSHAALLRLALEHGFEVHVLRVLRVLALEALPLVIEVENGARATRCPAPGLLGEVAGLTRGGRAGGAVIALAKRRSRTRREVVVADAEPVALVGHTGLGRRRRSEAAPVATAVPIPVSACAPAAVVGTVAAVRHAVIEFGQLPAVAGPWGFLLGLAVLCPRCRSAPVYIEVEIEVVCHVAKATLETRPAPGSCFACI